MNLMFLDMEFAHKDGKKCISVETLIEVGVVIYDLDTQGSVMDRAWRVQSAYPVDEFIHNYTGLTQEDVDNGIPIDIMAAELGFLAKEYDPQYVICYGGKDFKVLRKLFPMLPKKRCLDVSSIFENHYHLAAKPAMGVVLDAIGDYDYRDLHNAVSDCHACAVIFFYLLRYVRIGSMRSHMFRKPAVGSWMPEMQALIERAEKEKAVQYCNNCNVAFMENEEKISTVSPMSRHHLYQHSDGRYCLEMVELLESFE